MPRRSASCPALVAARIRAGVSAAVAARSADGSVSEAASSSNTVPGPETSCAAAEPLATSNAVRHARTRLRRMPRAQRPAVALTVRPRSAGRCGWRSVARSTS